jgi:hypothetical protein
MQTIASFWQVVGWIAGLLLMALAVGFIVWRRRHRGAGLYSDNPSQGTPPAPPRKPNGEDRTS